MPPKLAIILVKTRLVKKVKAYLKTKPPIKMMMTLGKRRGTERASSTKKMK